MDRNLQWCGRRVFAGADDQFACGHAAGNRHHQRGDRVCDRADVDFAGNASEGSALMDDRPRSRCEELETDPRVHRVEMLISSLLRIGVVTSLSIVIIVTVISFWRHPDCTSM